MRRPTIGFRPAGLIDGDNMTRGGELTVEALSSVLDQIGTLLVDARVAFAMQTNQAIQYMTAYAARPWGLQFAPMGPDAADELLLDAGEDFIAHHVHDLVVASGDHCFAELATHARLHVVSYRSSLSRRLELAATTIHYLDEIQAAA